MHTEYTHSQHDNINSGEGSETFPIPYLGVKKSSCHI